MIDDEGYNQDWEVVFQTVRAPLSSFQPAGNSKAFDPSKLRIVRLKFDRTAHVQDLYQQYRLRQTVIQPLSGE